MLLLIVVVEIKQNALMCVLINYIQQGKRHNIFAGRRGGVAPSLQGVRLISVAPGL